jgi:hypothetical protein
MTIQLKISETVLIHITPSIQSRHVDPENSRLIILLKRSSYLHISASILRAFTL